MPDKEKIIKGLERCLICDISVVAPEEAQNAYRECEYTVGLYCGQKKLLREALALLKEQQEQIENLKQTAQSMMEGVCLLKEQEHGETFTVIDTKTGKEADEYAIALHEDWAKHLCYCDMEGWAIENDGTLLLVDECGRFAYADRERFKVVWDA